MIVTCHILQKLDNNICFFLNAGVPVFLFISGFLYGKIKVNTWKGICNFYYKRIVRILPVYYMMLLIIIVVNILTGTPVMVKEVVVNVLCLQQFFAGIPNSGHLWYISCIILCYLITPVISWLVQKAKALKTYLQVFIYGLFAVTFLLTFVLIRFAYFYIYIMVYIFGFAVSSYKLNEQELIAKIVRIVFPVIVALWISLIFVDSILYRIPSVLRFGTNIIFAILLSLFFINKNIKKHKILDISDNYSYEIYLSHHIFILGSLSTIGLTGILPVDVMIAVICISIVSFFLNYCNRFIFKTIYGERK